MQINVIHYEPHTLSSRPFKFFFQQLDWFLQLQSCFIKWYEKESIIILLVASFFSKGHLDECEVIASAKEWYGSMAK